MNQDAENRLDQPNMMQDFADFQKAKAIVVGFSFCFLMGVQFLWPYHHKFWLVAKNWLSNLPLGATHAAFTGFVTTTWLVPITLASESRSFVAEWLQRCGEESRIVVSVVALDLTAYIWHRANHSWPFLWRFHAVHHSDVVFDVSSALRFHPGEVLLSTVIRFLVVVLFGLPWKGVLVFETLFAISNFFQHANLRLPSALERAIGSVFVIPAFHRLHHSTLETHQHKNFATIFSVWDRLGRTFVRSSSSDIMASGLSPVDRENRSFLRLMVMPLKRMI